MPGSESMGVLHALAIDTAFILYSFAVALERAAWSIADGVSGAATERRRYYRDGISHN